MADLSRRALLRGHGRTGCDGGAGRHDRMRGAAARTSRRRTAAAPDRSARDRKLVFANWPLYIDVDDDDKQRAAHPGRLRAAHRDLRHVHRGDQRQRRVLRQDQPGADEPPEHRPRPDRHQRLDVRPVRTAGLGPGDGPGAPSRTSPSTSTRCCAPRTSTPAASTPCPGSPGSPASPTTAGSSAGRSSTPSDLWKDDLRGRVTLLSGLDESFALLMQGNGVDITRWTADDFHRMCRPDRPLVSQGHIRRFTGNDYIKDLDSRRCARRQAYSRRCDPAPGGQPGHRVRGAARRAPSSGRRA